MRSPPSDDACAGVKVDGATRALFEKHQICVPQVHFHRHDVLLARRWRVAAVDEVQYR
jgi:hypothetical protein